MKNYLVLLSGLLIFSASYAGVYGKDHSKADSTQLGPQKNVTAIILQSASTPIIYSVNDLKIPQAYNKDEEGSRGIINPFAIKTTCPKGPEWSPVLHYSLHKITKNTKCNAKICMLGETNYYFRIKEITIPVPGGGSQPAYNIEGYSYIYHYLESDPAPLQAETFFNFAIHCEPTRV